MKRNISVVFLLMAGISIQGLMAQGNTWTYSGCPNVTDNDFSYSTIVKRGQQPDSDLLEPLKMTLYQHPTGEVDIFYTERRGALKVYHGGSQTVTTLRTFDVPWSVDLGGTAENAEDGLVGVTLDPNFPADPWIYVFYSARGEEAWRVSRFTLNNSFTNVSDEKIILEIPVQMEICCHQGGSLAFDDYGDLWITVGNNEGRGGGVNETEKNRSGEWGASSTASLRGAVLRIHPERDGSYSIPEGNFWEYYADYFENEGNSSLATEYRNPDLVKRELYVKGNRNPFSITLDPTRRWLGYGDVGPDGSAPSGNGEGEEYNLHQTPAFAGWPYFAGMNHMNAGNRDPDQPMNTSVWNMGVDELPPAALPFDAFRNSSSLSGPLYRYNPNQQTGSTKKFPPHFHRKWFVTNWATGQVEVLTPNAEGTSMVDKKRIFANHQFFGPLDMKMGPDGALYILHYAGAFSSSANTQIERIEYTGPDCEDQSIVWEYAACKDSTYSEYDANATHSNPADCQTPVSLADKLSKNARGTIQLAILDNNGFFQLPLGYYHLTVYNLKGGKVWEQEIDTGKLVKAPGKLSPGLYKVILK